MTMAGNIWKLEFWKNLVEDFITTFVATFFAQGTFAGEFTLQHLKVALLGAAGVVVVRAFTPVAGSQGSGRFNVGVHSSRQVRKRQAVNGVKPTDSS